MNWWSSNLSSSAGILKALWSPVMAPLILSIWVKISVRRGGLLISPKGLDELFAVKYKATFDLIHKYGARAMMHICGSIRKLIPRLIDLGLSIRKLIPRLIDLGLDVLDVVQTNAVDMNLEDLERDAKGKLTYAGTMCVQDVLPHKKPAEVRQEVKRPLELFSDGGLVICPSHQL